MNLPINLPIKLCAGAGAVLFTVLLANHLPSARAQQNESPTRLTQLMPSGLTAHGHAEIKIKPDMATLTVGVTTTARKPSDAARENASQSNAINSALKAAGVAASDIQTQSYTVQPQYTYENNKTRLIGYQVTNSVQVITHDLTKIGDVIDAATQAGANQVEGPSFDIADHAKAEGDALAAATANATGKAARMAEAAHSTLGPLRSLTDGEAPTVRPIMMERAMVAAAPGGGAPTPIAPGQITITANVTAVYELR